VRRSESQIEYTQQLGNEQGFWVVDQFSGASAFRVELGPEERGMWFSKSDEPDSSGIPERT